ncbi:YhdP family protein [Janthinobacterium agaricidamnosum]|uniref:Transmembrane protein n=1 Tax=Janthinobacterium agaricidamnosum NBRC 102515 = DSM 9628 TaxID=1349767 RepID=W0VAL4_9BURK|nr:YhdP family protein [Janthinobacterium agaricidamnosum]CDG84921.1 transmembrane protein [Janthinobacterium agaricidamnosum NBRC 102515 = DSM 9628]
MQKPPEQSATAHVPLAVRWSRLRAAYRMANLASHHVLGFTIKLALLAYFAFAVVFLFLRYAVLPNIDYYKGDIERLASKALGNPVAIARIYASWNGLRPSLFLGDVTVHDKDGRQALSLPSVSATLSWWSVLYGTVRFESLEIIRPDLDIRRATDGKLYVAGILIETRPGADGKGADWVLSQREIVIREGRLRWTDDQYQRPELALDNVNLLLRNKWRNHQLGLQATPPAALAAPLDVRANFSHPAFAARLSDVTMWKGELYADLKNADLAVWRSYVGNYVNTSFELSQGKGALRAWISLDHAKLAGFTADLHLSEVQARLAKDVPQLDLRKVDGRISAKEDFMAEAPDSKPTFGARGHSVVLTNFSLETSDGLSLPPTTLSEQYVAAARGKPQKMRIEAKLLDLQTLAALAGRLPMSPQQRGMLEEVAPRGRLQDFSAEWQGELPAVTSYRIRGQLDGLGLNPQAARPAQPKTATGMALAAAPALPGFENLSGSIDASDKGGALTIRSHDLLLKMPGYFSEPAMPFETMNVLARWMFEDKKQLRVQVEQFDFVQQGLKGSLKGSHVLPLDAAGSGPGQVDISGTLDNFDLKTIGRYLPLETPPDLHHWLTGALEDGMAHDVSVRLRGDLAEFPFKADTAAQRAAGEFRVAGKLADARLNYAPGEYAADGKAPLWPQAEHIKGSFVFDRARMEIRGDTATTGGAALSAVKAVIPDLTLHDMMLDIDGNAAAPMQEFLKYVAASPVLGWIDHFTDETLATGNAKLALKLHLPLSHLLESKVQGSVQLGGNDVVLFRDLPPVLGGTGKIEFNEKGVNLNGLNGNLLGGPVAISGGTQKDNSIQVRIAGAMTAEGLRKTYPAPVMQRLAGHVSGGARYSGLITARDHQVVVAVDSPLTGMGLDFPAPLKKNAGDSLPVRFVLTGNVANDAGVRSDDIRINVGSGIAARYQRQKQGKEPWRLLRGGIGVNVAAPEPDSGMALNVNMKSLDVDAWIAAGSAIAGPSGGKDETADSGDMPDIGQYVIPDAMAARAGELLLGERKLENVVVGATHQKDVWQANIEAKQVAGYVTWIETPSGLGKMTARLSSLTIPEADAAEVKNLLENNKSAAQSIPSLDIIAERFELFNKQLGRLELRAYNTIAAGGREWRIGKLGLATPDGELKGSGKWVIKDGDSTTSLNFNLDIIDAGKLLDRFGFADTVRRGKGKLSGDIAWKGLPYSLDIPTLSGQIQMNVESGQFLKQDPGAAKLLGVLSLQALPRLLKLDFHDVFSEGLAFDGITANASISHGVVKTENLKMHGVAATVLMDGTADIANESTNLQVVVIPEFNLGTGPLVYALAVNPVIGIGSFLAQLFLRAPVMKALTYHMQIKGPWKAPQVTKLDPEKMAPLPVPAADAKNTAK